MVRQLFFGKVGSFVGTANVSVEIPTGEAMPIAEYKDGEWKNSQLGGTDLVVSALENGVKINYTGNGTGRGAYINWRRAAACGVCLRNSACASTRVMQQ